MKKKVTVFGSFVVDLMGRTPGLPTPGETVKGSYFKMSPGGKGSNQAVAAKKAGASVTMITKVGKDQFKDIAINSFTDLGIDTKYVFEDDEKPTGVALIIVDEISGQNLIGVIPGASNNITSQDIEKAREEITTSEILLLQLETNLDAIEQVVDIGHKNNVKVILNPAPVIPLPEEVYKKIYAITPNEIEAEKLSGIPIKNDEDLPKVSQYFHDRGVENVILTLGDKGAYISTPDENKLLKSIKVDVIDTTGAGDAFNGGLVAGLSNGKDIIEASRYAMIVAGLSVTKVGTSVAMPTADEINKYLNEIK